MHKFLLLAFLSCFFYQDDDVSIIWSGDLELEWSDFKADPKPQGNAAALTASGITFGFSSTKTKTELVDFTFDVKSHFYPNQSWRINEPLSDIVLAHERLHFDITEIFARKFRQRIANTTFTMNINVEMERIHNAINNELSEMQNKYDKETNHSQIVEKQMEWQKLIGLEINKLSKYK
jgi:hypothetical protein